MVMLFKPFTAVALKEKLEKIFERNRRCKIGALDVKCIALDLVCNLKDLVKDGA